MIPAKPVVLDATDVPIHRPTHRNSQRVASSNTHTLKTIIVILALTRPIMVALHVAAPNEPSICRGFFLQVLSKYSTVLFVSCTVKVPG